MDQTDRFTLAEWAMDQALRSGADQAAVRVSNRRAVQVAFRDRRLEKLKESVFNRLHLEVYVDQRFSAQSTNDLRKDALRDFIEQALAATRHLTADEHRSLPDPVYYPDQVDVNLEILDHGYGQIRPQDRVSLAAAIEAAAMGESDKIVSTTSGYEDAHSEVVQVHSNGFRGEVRSTTFEAGAEVTVRGEGEKRPEDWAWARMRFYHDLPDVEGLGVEAATRALRKVGSVKLPSGRYAMVVENRVGRRLISMLLSAMTGSALQQKNSFLEGMQGKQIASQDLTLIDDPTLTKGLGSRVFDGQGLAARRRVMIEQGILQHYYIDDYYGRKLGMRPTSGGPSNMVFEYGPRSMGDMINGLEHGILVTGFIGGNSNSTTGDFSIGIFGFQIDHGEIVQPVNEMNIAGDAKEFWRRLVAMGNDPYPYSAHRVPSMLFEGVDFSGT